VAIFALGPVKSPRDEEEWQGSRDQLDGELEKHPWLKAVAVEILGGKFDPAKLRFPLSIFAGSEPASDIRDWAVIREWTKALAAKLEPAQSCRAEGEGTSPLQRSHTNGGLRTL